MSSERIPRVSVVVPTCNRAALLSQAVDSALAQTFTGFEIIIVDDGSTDGTGEMVERRYGADPRVRLVRKTNGGVSSATNEGIRQARADLVALLGDDDVWYPEKLALQVQALERRPDAGLCCCDFDLTGTGGSGRTVFGIHDFQGEPTLEAIVRSCFAHPSSMLLRRSVALEAGLFDESFPTAEDYDLWLRMLALRPGVCVPRVLGVYRHHAGPQLSDDRARLHAWQMRGLEKNRERILRAAGPERARFAALIDARIRYHRVHHHGWRARQLLSQDPRPPRLAVLREMLAAIRLEPWRLKHYRRLAMVGFLGTGVAGRYFLGRAARKQHRAAANATPPITRTDS